LEKKKRTLQYAAANAIWGGRGKAFVIEETSDGHEEHQTDGMHQTAEQKWRKRTCKNSVKRRDEIKHRGNQARIRRKQAGRELETDRREMLAGRTRHPSYGGDGKSFEAWRKKAPSTTQKKIICRRVRQKNPVP